MNDFSRETLLSIIETDHVQCGEASALARMALAAMDSEPVAYAVRRESGDLLYPAECRRQAEWQANNLGDAICIPLYRHAQPAAASKPVIADCDPEVFEKGASACLVAIPKETAEVICKGISAVTGCKVDWHYIGGRVHIKALRLAQQPAPVVPENCVTAEHRRVIEMLLRVCGAAFELEDDSCHQDVDGEECHIVPSDAFQKLSDALDEIENTLSTEDIDRPDVFLAWSAMPRAALKSLLQAGNSPVIPDGYVMVPKEPTERMVIDGFESEPDETFSEPEVWEAYEAMSGCEQAHYRARLCWAAMVAAAMQEVKVE